jgi:hypothetical protein
MVSLEGSLITRLGEMRTMDIINLEIDGNSTYLMTYLGDLFLPHRTLILLVVIAITLRCVKLFRERK